MKTPIYCKEGWNIVFAGSRFLNEAETRYAAVEGECLASSWAMNKCKHFLLGCENFILAVDHRPLLGVLNDKSLETIENPRLQRLKEKTLRFKFSVVHVPGIMHKTSDATSRSPVSDSEQEILKLSTINRMLHDIKSDKIQSDIQSDKSNNLREISYCQEENEPVSEEQFLEGLARGNITNISSMDPSILTLHANIVSWESVKTESAKDDKLVALAKGRKLPVSKFVQTILVMLGTSSLSLWIDLATGSTSTG